MRSTFVAVILFTSIIFGGGNAMALEITSGAFSNEKTIPAKYTCKGSDISPPLAWSGAPAGTKSFALIADDPDAPGKTWVHWVAWNIPATSTGLKEDLEKTAQLPDGTMQGTTDFGRVGYGGPCPPSGTHRYYFKLSALDTTLDLPSTTTKAELESAMKGHVLEQAQMMGTFSK